MRKKWFNILLISVAISATACTKDLVASQSEEVLDEVTLELICSTGTEGTRTQVNNDKGKIFWSPFDSIYVIKVDEGAGVLFGQNDIPASTAKFAGVLHLLNGGKSDTPYYGVYPYRSGVYYNSKDDVISVDVPSEQTAVAGTYDPMAFPALAKFQNNSNYMYFRNVCGGLRFKVATSGVKSVEFTGNNSEVLSGSVEVGIIKDTIPTVVRVVNPERKVTLVCEEGFEPGKWYYISMLPANLDEGFTITLKTNAETVRYVSRRKTQVKRSVFGELSHLDKGLFSGKEDWIDNDFIHKSLLLSIPNRVFSGSIVSTPGETINSAINDTKGNLEVAQMFANGSGTTAGVFDLLTMFNTNTVPFFITDYRQSGTSGIASTCSKTHSLYGTVSGIALNSHYNGNELSVDVSLYFKANDNYRIVTLITQEETSYSFTYQSGRYSSTTKADFLTRYVASSILGDDITVASAPEVKYKSYKVNVSNTYKSGKLRALVYVLRPYGSRNAVTNGNFGSYYVDNAFSARVGAEQALPIQISIDSEINDFQDGGTI